MTSRRRARREQRDQRRAHERDLAAPGASRRMLQARESQPVSPAASIACSRACAAGQRSAPQRRPATANRARGLKPAAPVRISVPAIAPARPGRKPRQHDRQCHGAALTVKRILPSTTCPSAGENVIVDAIGAGRQYFDREFAALRLARLAPSARSTTLAGGIDKLEMRQCRLDRLDECRTALP